MFNSKTYQRKLEDLIQDDGSNLLVIYGDQDEFTSIVNYERWSQQLDKAGGQGLRIVGVRGGTHFWHGRAGETMKQCVTDFSI